MLVRFNKGPWHRRLRDMHPSDLRNGIFNVAVMDNKMFNPRMYDTSPNSQLHVAPGHKIAVYRVKMVSIDLHDGRGTRTFPSVYPDGAICFEHTETL